MGINMPEEKLSSLELQDVFDKMSDSNLTSYEYLANFIYNKVGLCLNTGKLDIEGDKEGCWGGVQAKQYPEELAKLLVFVYNNRYSIKSYCEIGVERGGTFFVVDSFLRSVNPNMGQSLAIEMSSRREKLFHEYIKKYPQVTFKCINSHNLEVDRDYDFCFIDGDHSYSGCKQDFEMMKPFSKFIAFHDIYFGGATVKDFWAELDGRKHEFLNDDKRFPVPLGIGLWVKELSL